MNRHILFFADASSVHTQRWVHEMARRGFRCSVATRRPAEVSGADDVIALQSGESGESAAGWFTALPAVRRLARQLQPRWLHGHYVTSYGLWGAACRSQVDAPLVLTAWGSDILVTPHERSLRGRVTAALLSRTLRRAELITADAAEVLDDIRGYGISARCEEVLWGADTELFRPGEPAPGFEICSLRVWEPNYRIDTVLRALALLTAARPASDTVLHLLGGGADAAALKALADALGIAHAVRFSGRVDEPTMLRTLQRCRVSISVPVSDATSVSVLESMACGLPVVASDLAANRQWIDPALLVRGVDAAALAKLLIRLHDDPVLCAAQGQRNRARVVERGSRKQHMDRMAELYEALA
jgi:glycosyltransferase involved in cell wall biosynthesis